ncbi:hypothetical protein YC2023_011385 [Brassica napus]
MVNCRNHLFFECVYSSQVWHNIGNRSGLTISSSWDQTLTALHHLSGPRHAKLLPLFTWQSTIYYIWSEQNARLHRNTYRPPDSISNSIGSYIKSKIVEIRTSSPRLSSSFFQLWHRGDEQKIELWRSDGTPQENYGYYVGGGQLYKVLETGVSSGDGSREE